MLDRMAAAFTGPSPLELSVRGMLLASHTHGTEGPMTIRQADSDDRINEVASDIQDLNTTVEELQNDLPSDIDPDSLDRLKNALDDAVDATDELEDQQDEADAFQPKE